MTKLKLIFAIIFSIVILLTFAGIYYYYEYIVPKPYGKNVAYIYDVKYSYDEEDYRAVPVFKINFDNTPLNDDIYYSNIFGSFDASLFLYPAEIPFWMYTFEKAYKKIFSVEYISPYSIDISQYYSEYFYEDGIIQKRKILDHDKQIVYIKNDNNLLSKIEYSDNLNNFINLDVIYNQSGYISELFDKESLNNIYFYYDNNNFLNKFIVSNNKENKKEVTFIHDDQNNLLTIEGLNVNDDKYSFTYYNNGMIKSFQSFQNVFHYDVYYKNDLISEIIEYVIRNDGLRSIRNKYIFVYKFYEPI